MSTRTLTPTNPFPDPSPSPEPNPNQVRGSAYARRPCSARCRAVSASSLASSRHSRTACAQHVHCMCTACALHVRGMCTASVLRVHFPSPSPRRAPQVDPGDGKTSAVNIFAQQPAQHGPHNTAKAGAVAQPPACLRPHAPRQRPTLPLARGCPLCARDRGGRRGGCGGALAPAQSRRLHCLSPFRPDGSWRMAARQHGQKLAEAGGASSVPQ